MVVGDLGAVADLFSVDGKRRLKAADASRAEDEGLHSLLHAVREIAAVRARVGAEAFLVEGLKIVQCLLGCIAEDAVGLALERG